MARGTDLRPAMLGAALLHAAVLGAGFVAWQAHEEEPEKLVTSVPVTLVSAADAPVAPAAAEGPGPPAPAPLPTAAAPPEPTPAPATPPEPAPAPPKTAAPPPRPGPGPQKAAPPAAKPQPQKPAAPAEPALDLDALASRIAKSAPRRQRPQPAPAAAEGTPDPRASLGGPSAGAQNALAALAAKLQELWNPNCQAEGGDTVNVRVRFQTSDDGRLIGQPQVVGGGGSALVRAAETRAVGAVVRGAPYEELPAELRGQAITVRFDAARACAG